MIVKKMSAILEDDEFSSRDLRDQLWDIFYGAVCVLIAAYE